MGLLDDAIKEHLELKRRHGADPGEVARLEHEALGPARRDPAPAAVDEPVAAEPASEPPPADDPFLDVDAKGVGSVLVTCVGVTVLFLALGAVLSGLDRRMPPTPVREAAPDPRAPAATAQ